MSKKFFWLKLKDDFFNQAKVKKLRSIAGGDTFTIIYLKLLLLSIKDEGKLFFESIEDDFTKELALKIDEAEENLIITISFLEKQGLMEVVDDDSVLLPEAVHNIGKESDSAERVRRLRQKRNQNVQIVDDTPSSVSKSIQFIGQTLQCNTELELEKEIESDQDQEQDSPKFELEVEDHTFEKLMKETGLNLDRKYFDFTRAALRLKDARLGEYGYFTWVYRNRKENIGKSDSPAKYYNSILKDPSLHSSYFDSLTNPVAESMNITPSETCPVCGTFFDCIKYKTGKVHSCGFSNILENDIEKAKQIYLHEGSSALSAYAELKDEEDKKAVLAAKIKWNQENPDGFQWAI
jgi:predicted phage replisome organizer